MILNKLISLTPPHYGSTELTMTALARISFHKRAVILSSTCAVILGFQRAASS
jgi:hypothetical protein